MQTSNVKTSITKPDEWVLKAIARIKNVSVKEAWEIWKALPHEKKGEIAKNIRIKYQILILKGEEAQRELESLQTPILLHRNVVEAKKSDYPLAQQLCEWMRWPNQATLDALRHLDEPEKARLRSKEGKILLTRLAREFSMDKYPDKCSARDIGDLIDEVLRRQVV